MAYLERDLVKIAKRENNKKRTYLIVNPLQGKHVPVSPKQAFTMFDALAAKLKDAYEGEKLLLVGFAETATAIGARLAICLRAHYIQTTRERLLDVEYLYFTESHSHATEQKLVREDIEQMMGSVDRIVFVEDEVTTGNTIFGIVKILEQRYPKKAKFSIASLLNGMDCEAEKICKDMGIDIHFLLKTSHKSYSEIAEAYRGDGRYVPLLPPEAALPKVHVASGYINARRCTTGDAYESACRRLWERIRQSVNVRPGQSVLVIGTEEFMYPALYVGQCFLEGGCIVKCHSTTRSPIAVSSEQEYPLHVRYELESFYEAGRRTFIYDLSAYDSVVIVTDAAELNQRGLQSLVQALCVCGNENIYVWRWRGE